MGVSSSAQPVARVDLDSSAVKTLNNILGEKYTIDPEKNVQFIPPTSPPRVVLLPSPMVSMKSIRDRLLRSGAFVVSSGVKDRAVSVSCRENSQDVCLLDLMTMFHANKTTYSVASSPSAAASIAAVSPRVYMSTIERPHTLNGAVLRQMLIDVSLRCEQLCARLLLKNTGFSVQNACEYTNICTTDLQSYVVKKKKELLEGMNAADDVFENDCNPYEEHTPGTPAVANSSSTSTPLRRYNEVRFDYSRDSRPQCEVMINDSICSAALRKGWAINPAVYHYECGTLRVNETMEAMLCMQMYPRLQDNLYVVVTLSKKWNYMLLAVALQHIMQNIRDSATDWVETFMTLMFTMLECMEQSLKKLKERNAHILHIHIDVPACIEQRGVEAFQLSNCPSVFAEDMLAENLAVVTKEICNKLSLMIENINGPPAKTDRESGPDITISSFNNQFFLINERQSYTVVRVQGLFHQMNTTTNNCIENLSSELSIYTPDHISQKIMQPYNQMFVQHSTWGNNPMGALLEKNPTSYGKFFVAP